MKNLVATVALVSTLALSGCATLSESQCIASDWQTIGHSDGVNGHQSSRLLKHQNACVKRGVVPDREAYLAGWEEGVERYCEPHNAFSAGQRGQRYSNVCPAHLADAFSAAYREGQRLHRARSEIAKIERAISQKEHRQKQIKSEIAATESSLVDDATTSSERRALLDETKALAQEQGQLETEIRNLKTEVAVKAERLENLRQSLALAAN